jgi:precorrin-6x reductase
MIVLICGSRDWTDVPTVEDAIAALPIRTVVIEGGADGADKIARQAARRAGLHVATVAALWERFSKGAGARRNRAMLHLRPDKVIAFHKNGSPGTADMIAAARAAGVPVEVIEARVYA